ncbi:MAG: type I methionyl aminopeptidase [Rickettsiales bacterium]|nr:type I methionyl aminopeptidase [Rickettsiales bacterium]
MIYSKEDFEGLRRAGRAAAETLDFVTGYVMAGVSTYDLDKLVAEHTKRQGGTCAPLDYHGYPKSCCISINDVICHGIPDKATYLAEGDILNIDVTTELGGYYGDTSRMYSVGGVSDAADALVGTTYECLMKAAAICGPGQSFAALGKLIQSIAESRGYSVVRDFCGHGIGKAMHQAPNVLHYYDPAMERVKMRTGMVFTIEPMINTGDWKMEIDKSNGWTARTEDGGLSAQFEHTIGITETGAEIFTLSPAGYSKPPYKK